MTSCQLHQYKIKGLLPLLLCEARVAQLVLSLTQLQSLMNCPIASEMCGHLQVPLHLLCGQHEEQQTEGHPERLEAQPVSAQWEEERCSHQSAGAH